MYDDVSYKKELNFFSVSSEEAQRESFSRLIAQIPMPFSILLGPEHIFALVNPATQSLVPDRVLLGKSFREALPEFEGQGFFETMDLVYETGEPYFAIETPVLLRRPDSTWEELYFIFTYQSLRNDNGEIEGVLQVGFEVTELVHARQQIEHQVSDIEAEHTRLQAVLRAEREARRQTEDAWQQLEAIFAAMTDGVFVYDAQGHLIRTNEAAQALLARYIKPDDRSLPLHLRAANYGPRAPEGDPLTPEQVPSMRILRGEILTGGKTADIIMPTFEGDDLWLNMSGTPLFDEQGNITGAIALARDVTVQRQLELRTREALNALLAMAEVMVTMPISLDSTGALSHFTPPLAHRLLELAAQVIGCKNATFVSRDPETDRAHLVASIGLTSEQQRLVLASVEGTSFSGRYQDLSIFTRLQTGEVQVLDLTRPPFRDQRPFVTLQQALVAPIRTGETLMGIMSFNRNEKFSVFSGTDLNLAQGTARLAGFILEQERLLRERSQAQASELAARESREKMNTFLGMVSHELKNPLTAIKGNVQLARRRLAAIMQQPPAESSDLSQQLTDIQSLLERAERQIGMQNRLVSDLLDVSRIQAGHLDLLLQRCDLLERVRAVVEDQRVAASPRAINLETPVGQSIYVLADADRIEQVINNYISNAIKYTSPDSPITVGIKVESQVARVYVNDQGPGLSEVDQVRIWERFYRVFNDERQHISGDNLGLGLYICRNIIERHGGQTGVVSTAGRGATFWFTLPLTKSDS